MSNCSGPGPQRHLGQRVGKNVLFDRQDLQAAVRRCLANSRLRVGRILDEAVGEERRRDEVVGLLAEQIEVQREKLGVHEIHALLGSGSETYDEPTRPSAVRIAGNAP